MINFLLKVVAILLMVAKGSSVTTPRNSKRLRHSDSDPINSKSLSHTDGRKLQTCKDGFTFNACAGCCGYKFTEKLWYDLGFAVRSYPLKNATYGEMNCWDVSDITDMSYLFEITGLNEPIGCWNVSKVTKMSGMFYSAWAFSQDIGNWDVSNVTDMSDMF